MDELVRKRVATTRVAASGREIALGDCEAEGIVSEGDHSCLLDEYIRLWNSHYAKRGYPWDDKLWVWVARFSRV